MSDVRTDAIEPGAIDAVRGATEGTAGGGRIGRSIDRWRAPARVEVAGRPGVGKSAVAAAVGNVAGIPVVEVHGVDSPDVADASLDADLLLYVLVRHAHPADLDALSSRSATDTVVVLAKADTLADVDEAVSRAEAATGLPVTAVDTGRPDDTVALRLLAEDALRLVSRRRARFLLAELEGIAAADPSVRGAVESFLRTARP